MGRMRRLWAAIALGAAMLALGTCSNAFDFVGTITDQVMVAKNLYLRIMSVSPVKNDPEANPYGGIKIEFDRDIDFSTVSTSSILLEPFVDWTASFDTVTHMLSVQPSALEVLTAYSVTVNAGLKGSDGSSLREPYAWGFTTREAPGGSISVTGLVVGQHKYVKTLTPTVSVSYNIKAKWFRVSGSDPPAYPAFVHVDGNSPDGSTATLPAGDGSKRVFVQFTDEPDVTRSLPEDAIYDTVILDQALPVADTGLPTTTYLNAASQELVPAATATDGNGITSYSWQQVGGTGEVSFSSSSVLRPTIRAESDGTAVVRLRVWDYAGNIGTAPDRTITIDTVAPGAPTLTFTPGPGTALPSYSWASGGGGAGYYRWKYDSDAWSAETTSTSYAPTSLTYGGHYFYVEERDAAGNWSSYDYGYYFYYPDYLRPIYAATGVSLTPKLIYGEGMIIKGTSWEVWARPSTIGTYTKIATTTTYSYQVPTALETNRKYYWYYKVIRSGTVIYTSPVYYFTTRT